MAEIDNIVSVTISKETQSVSKAGYGIPAIVAKFAIDDTTVTFNRTRFYGSLDEVVADGWSSTTDVYKAFSALFAQNPNVSTAMLGRWDTNDATLTDALGAINLDNADWYVFTVIGQKESTLSFSTNFITGNVISAIVNGTTIPDVTFDTDQATTMGLLETAIETAITGSTAVATGTDILITIDDVDVNSSAVITGGASQPTAVGYSEADQVAKDAGAWSEANKKIFFTVGSNPDIADASIDTDLFTFLQGVSYERTVGIFKKDASQYMEMAWPGECLPFDPGSQTWAFKTIAGVSPDGLTTSEKKAVLGKGGNTYQAVSGVNITRNGNVFSGEFIDIVRGVDWLETEIQTEVFSNLVNKRKVPYNDSGIQLIEGALGKALQAGANAGVLQEGSIAITVPLYADISTNDKANRNLPDVKFTALLLGAIHTVQISGTLSL